MPIKRKLIKLGNSRVITIPNSWLEYHEEITGKPVKHLLLELDGEIVIRVPTEALSEQPSSQG